MRQLSSDITSHVIAQLKYCNFACRKVATILFKEMIKKGADQTVWIGRLVCTFVVCMKSIKFVFQDKIHLILHS